MNIIKSEILDNYYLQIETIDEFIPHSIFPSMEDVTEYELKYLRIEYWTGTILNEKDTIGLCNYKYNIDRLI